MNTGAILNRINFGMAAAAGRLPGATIGGLPVLDTVRTAPREKQVDAVVATVLNGMASPDTRAVLLSGEHPLLREAGGAKGEAESGMQDASGANADMTEVAMEEGGDPLRKNQNAGGKRAAMQGRGLGNIPQLTGLPQIVGLALGSPEFQRH